MQLAQFDVDGFLRDHWQQRPLLIRNAWDAWENPLDPDELAGLACEHGVESRLVTATPESRAMEHGPLMEERFAALDSTAWTLLVQAVDHHAPAVAALLDSFRFIPNWRIDDVMVSYAADGGGVGAHFDNYDVFLIQGLGRRRWRIGAKCDGDTPLLPNPDLRLLADFRADDEFVLEPGDMLYVPPGFAHDGVAVGDDCMTYSIGFRAPSRGELVAGWSEQVLAALRDDDRYGDPGLVRQDNPGEIATGATDALFAMVMEALSDRAAFDRWVGEHATQPRNSDIDWHNDEPASSAELRRQLTGAAPLERNPAGRFAFIARDGGGVTLFVNGEAFDCTGGAADFARLLCKAATVPVNAPETLCDETMALIAALFERGMIAIAEPD